VVPTLIKVVEKHIKVVEKQGNTLGMFAD